MDDDGALERWRKDKRFNKDELKGMASSCECAEWTRLENEATQARTRHESLKQAATHIPRGMDDLKLEAKAKTDEALKCYSAAAASLGSFLSHGNDGVLGGWTRTSPWFRPSRCLEIATGYDRVPTDDDRDGWEYVRDPMPSRHEDPALRRIRDHLGAEDKRWQFKPEALWYSVATSTKPMKKRSIFRSFFNSGSEVRAFLRRFSCVALEARWKPGGTRFNGF